MFFKLLAEFIGTAWLVFGGCGSAVLAATFGGDPEIGIHLLGVAFAFGLTVLTMAYAIGHISGCHLNPAVSFGLFFGGRFSVLELIPYIIAQTAGAFVGALLLWTIASGKTGWTHPGVGAGAFATNGFGDLSPGGFNFLSCAIAEFVLTFMFLIIILGSTDKRAPAGFAPLPIGLGLTLIHLIGIPVTNLSVNPARSTGPALILGLDSPQVLQLWFFWAFPIAGAIAAGIVYRILGAGGSTSEK